METVRLFTNLIRFELCGKAVSHPPLSVEEAKALFLLAKKHDLAHVAANGAIRAGLLPDDPRVKEVYKKACLSALVRYESLAMELVLITALFEEAKIVHLPLKGSVLRALYPAPWMRSSCDIDILVHEEDIERAKSILLEKGYRPFSSTAHDVSFDSPRGVHIELHFRLLEEGVSAVMQETLSGVWSYASPREGRVYEQMLSDDFFYYYHIAHMAKHYLHGGCGIRPFLDLWMLRHRIFFDEGRREALLKAGGLLSFAKAAESLGGKPHHGGTSPTRRQARLRPLAYFPSLSYHQVSLPRIAKAQVASPLLRGAPLVQAHLFGRCPPLGKGAENKQRDQCGCCQ